MTTQTSVSIEEITEVAPTQTSIPIDAITEATTQTSIPILDDSTPSQPKLDPKISLSNFVCRALLIIILGSLTFSVLFTLPLLVFLLLLMLSFIVVTLVQFIRHGDQYDKATQLKFAIRFWLFLASLLFVAGIEFMLMIAKNVWDLQHVMLMGLSITKCLDAVLEFFYTPCFLSFLVIILIRFLPPTPLDHNERGLNVQEAVSEIVDCLVILFSLYRVMKQSTDIKHHKVLGLYTWKWIVVVLFLVIGYNIVRVCTHMSVWLVRRLIAEKLDPMRMKCGQHKMLVKNLLPREYFVYYANGLKRSISFILSSLLTLLTWVLYFRPRLSKTVKADHIVLFVTRTCVSLLVCSVLWLLKTLVVLSWEATVMYTRLKPQILDSRNKLYFLGILGRQSHDILNLTYSGPLKRKYPDNHRVWFLFGFLACFRSFSHELNSYDLENLGVGITRRLWEVIIIYLNMFIDMTRPDFLIRSTNDTEEDDVQEKKDNLRRVKKLSGKKRKTSKYELLMHKRTPTMYDIKQVSQYLISAKQALSDPTFVTSIVSRLKPTPESDIRDILMQLIDEKSTLNGAPSSPNVENDRVPVDGLPVQPAENIKEVGTQNSRASSINETSIQNAEPSDPNGSSEDQAGNEELGIQNKNESDIQISSSSQVIEDDWEYFKQKILKNEVCDACSELLICTWLEKAKENCLFLANALSSTNEVVNVLNTIVSCVLIGVTFIMWLLLTNLASTKVLVLIASPLVAATFVFGDTCKTLFQGIMYVYVVHPIHVGDLCSVDGDKMMVKAVGVWTTTFCKVENLGTLEEVTYPNSELANKVVINHLNEFVWDDSIEFDLDSLQSSDVKELKNTIKTYLNRGQDEFVSCSHSVVIQPEGDDFKIIIKLKYKIADIQDWSYHKCLRRKNKIQADVNDLVKKIQKGSGTIGTKID